MPYAVVYTPRARKELKSLSQDLQERVFASLERIRIRPRAFVKRLVGSPFYALRVGDHRVILDLKDGKLIILVITLGRRENIYRKL